ncbi:MAG: hypothetical protein H6773_00465 [Pseudomonadales bacterium]|nr:hypothetical protein [Pseudomonadales bacterium]
MHGWLYRKGDEKAYVSSAKFYQEVEAIYDFLVRIRKKNQELNLRSNPYTPTFGLEIEYTDPAMYKAYRDARLSGSRTRLNILLQAQTLAGKQADVTTFNDTFVPNEHMYQIREGVTYPADSNITLLRSLLFAIRNSAFEGETVAHETYGGIKLSPEHTEVMDARAILEASGIINSATSAPSTDCCEIHRRFTPLKDGNTQIHFPYFSNRSESKITPLHETEDQKLAVEWRSFPIVQFNPQNPSGFNDYIRKCIYEMNACTAIKAVQKSVELRDAIEHKLADAWQSHMTAWEELLSEYSIQNTTNDQRYVLSHFIQGTWQIDDNPASIPYNKMLHSIRRKSNVQPEFRKKSKRLIREFNKSIKAILLEVSQSQT